MQTKAFDPSEDVIDELGPSKWSRVVVDRFDPASELDRKLEWPFQMLCFSYIDIREKEANITWNKTTHLLPVQDSPETQTGQDHKRNRTMLPRSPAQNQAHGNLPGRNLIGPNPLRWRRKIGQFVKVYSTV